MPGGSLWRSCSMVSEPKGAGALPPPPSPRHVMRAMRRLVPTSRADEELAVTPVWVAKTPVPWMPTAGTCSGSSPRPTFCSASVRGLPPASDAQLHDDPVPPLIDVGVKFPESELLVVGPKLRVVGPAVQ